MAPYQVVDSHILERRNTTDTGSWREHATTEAFVLESWSEGLIVGALMIMSCTTVANMRRGVLLHKLILLEVSRVSNSINYCAYTVDIAITRDHSRYLLLYVL